MKQLHLALTSLFVLMGIATTLYAGGSFHLNDISPLLKDSREWREIENKYQVDPTGDAVRFGNQWAELGAGRCGPYQLTAKLKESDKSPTYNIIIETYITFLKNGKPITKDLEANADDYRESVVKIVVLEDGKDAVEKNSPEAMVRMYFDRVNERAEKEAYACFSAGFQEHKPLKSYSATFADTKEVQVFTAKTSNETEDSAAVTIRMVVWDAKGRSSAWAGPLKLTKSDAGWKINDMSGLVEK